MTDSDVREDLLEKTGYVDVLLSIIGGHDYPTAIAKVLEKKQPTVTEQLGELKAAGLVSLGERKKAQRYVVEWSALMEEFEGFVFDILEGRKEYGFEKLQAKVKKVGVASLVPLDLLRIFLRQYFSVLLDVGGVTKGYYEICLSFFKALEDLDRKDYQLLVSTFKIDGKLLGELAELMALEISVVELEALQAYIGTDLRKRKPSR